MIADLKPYAEYKESGLPWLGDIPLHWEPTPNRAHLRIRKLPVGQRHPEYQLLSLTKRGVIVRDLSENRGKFSSDMGTSQEVRVGDLVFCLFDVPETPRTVGLSRHAGMITGAYTVMECADPKIARFFEAFYIAMDDRKLLSPLYSGLRNTIPKVRFLGAKTPLPPPDEQTAIVRFLDWADGRLERTIRAKRKVIALLNEQKQAIIHRAVTCGLDPSVPFKPSGIPWLGDIPQHWEVLPFMRLFAEVYRYPTYYDIQYVKSGVPEVRGEALVHGKIAVLPDQRYIDGETNSRFPRTILKEGDLVMSVRGTMGKIGVVGESHVGANITANLLRLSPRQEVAHPHYLSWLTRSPGFLRELDRVSPQTTIKTVTMPQLAGLRLCVPPLTEQTAIVDDVEKSIGRVNAAISRLAREIELLREYRTRLVADVVTGKLDVREALSACDAQAGAARMPDESEMGEQESLDEDEAMLEEPKEGEGADSLPIDEEDGS
jgi:type I restriction enzyme S subunit